MKGFSNVVGDGLSLAKRVLSGSVSSLCKLKIIVDKESSAAPYYCVLALSLPLNLL